MAEKLQKLGIEKEKGYLYFVDKEGDVARAKMARRQGLSDEEKQRRLKEKMASRSKEGAKWGVPPMTAEESFAEYREKINSAKKSVKMREKAEKKAAKAKARAEKLRKQKEELDAKLADLE